MGKNSTVNFPPDRISLAFVENPTPVREVLIDEFEEDFLITLNPFGVQDPVKSSKEF